jgi:hypothetical protein
VRAAVAGWQWGVDAEFDGLSNGAKMVAIGALLAELWLFWIFAAKKKKKKFINLCVLAIAYACVRQWRGGSDGSMQF